LLVVDQNGNFIGGQMIDDLKENGLKIIEQLP
jgi:hypothetical protein